MSRRAIAISTSLSTAPALAFSYDRLSSLSQQDGLGLQRQRDQREAWLKERPHITLVRSMEDIGFSGWSGLHRAKGVLGGFEALVDDDEIAPGSYLILDALDRLTREEIDDGLELLLKFIRKGINIVTTSDGEVYTRRQGKAVLFFSLFKALIKLNVAGEESDLKSDRHLANWSKKREAAASGKRLTARRKGWLLPREPGEEVPEDIPHNNLWQAHPIHYRTVVEMFELSGDKAYGATKIINHFMGLKRPCPTEGSQSRNTGKWSATCVRRILTSRCVLGEFEMSAYGPDGKTRGVVKTLPDYYPRIISDELWDRTQAGIKRRTDTTVREGERVQLVVPISRCAACSGPMGRQPTPPGREERLVCRARSTAVSLCPTAASFALTKFERNLRKVLRVALKVDLVAPDGNGLAERLAAVEAQIEQETVGLDALLDAFGAEAGEDDRRAIERRKAKLASLRDQRKALVVEQSMRRGEVAPNDAAAQMEALWDQALAGDMDVRRTLAGLIRQVLSRIDCYPDKRTVYRFRSGLTAGIRAGDMILSERFPECRNGESELTISYNFDKPDPVSPVVRVYPD